MNIFVDDALGSSGADDLLLKRPELEQLLSTLRTQDRSVTLVLGSPGSGKTTLIRQLCEIGQQEMCATLAIKADAIPSNTSSEDELAHQYGLSTGIVDWVEQKVKVGAVLVCVDQLDAIAALADLHTGRLQLVMKVIKRISSLPNVHIVMTCREFEADYDTRLKSIEAERITLENLTEDQVSQFLKNAGVEAAKLPAKLRELLLTPLFAALAVKMKDISPSSLAELGSYHAALDLWVREQTEIGEFNDLDVKLQELAAYMAETESLWVPISAAKLPGDLNRLLATGLLTEHQDKRRIAFSHQTLFDHWFSRWALRRTASFIGYVKDRQGALFVRPRIWSVLLYCRDVYQNQYHEICDRLWRDPDVKRHVKYLLIDHIAQASGPLHWEVEQLREGAEEKGFTRRVLRATAKRPDWFDHFDRIGLLSRLLESDGARHEVTRWLGTFWLDRGEKVKPYFDQIRRSFDRVGYLQALVTSPTWSAHATELAMAELGVSGEQGWSERLFRRIADHDSRAGIEALAHWMDRDVENCRADSLSECVRDWVGRSNGGRSLVWLQANELATDHPLQYLNEIAPRLFRLLEVSLNRVNRILEAYPSLYLYDLDEPMAEVLADYSAMGSLDVAASRCSGSNREDFGRWLREMSSIEVMPVQRLLAYFYVEYVEGQAAEKERFLFSDPRRLLLGESVGDEIAESRLLFAHLVECSDDENRQRLAKMVIHWAPQQADNLEPESKRYWLKKTQRVRSDLLDVIPLHSRTKEVVELIGQQVRATGSARLDRVDVEGGFVGSKMSDAAMKSASVHEIVNYLLELPDVTEWSHPRHFSFGGSIQASRAFAAMAVHDINKARAVMRNLPAESHQRPVGYAIEEWAKNDESCATENEVLALIAEFWDKGFRSHEFVRSSAAALEAVANRGNGLDEPSISWLMGRLEDARAESFDDEDDNLWKDDDESTTSVLFGIQGGISVPVGTYSLFSPIYLGMLRRDSVDLDVLEERVKKYLEIEKSSTAVAFFCYYLHWFLGRLVEDRASDFVSMLVRRHALSIVSRGGALLFAKTGRSIRGAVKNELIYLFLSKDAKPARLAAGELAGVFYILHSEAGFASPMRDEWIRSGPEFAIGLVNAAVNLWREVKTRERAWDLLSAVSCMKALQNDVGHAFADFFRVNPPEFDALTLRVYRLFAENPSWLFTEPGGFLSDHLLELTDSAPKDALSLVDAVTGATINESGLGRVDFFQEELAETATVVSLTLQRFGGDYRESALRVFERLLELEVPSAHQSIVELDSYRGNDLAYEGRRPRRARRRRRPVRITG